VLMCDEEHLLNRVPYGLYGRRISRVWVLRIGILEILHMQESPTHTHTIQEPKRAILDEIASIHQELLSRVVSITS